MCQNCNFFLKNIESGLESVFNLYSLPMGGPRTHGWHRPCNWRRSWFVFLHLAQCSASSVSLNMWTLKWGMNIKFQIPILTVQLGLKGGWIVLGIWNIHTKEHSSQKKQANLGIYKIKGQHMLIPSTKHDISPSIYDVPLLFTKMNGTGLNIIFGEDPLFLTGLTVKRTDPTLTKDSIYPKVRGYNKLC